MNPEDFMKLALEEAKKAQLLYVSQHFLLNYCTAIWAGTEAPPLLVIVPWRGYRRSLTA